MLPSKAKVSVLFFGGALAVTAGCASVILGRSPQSVERVTARDSDPTTCPIESQGEKEEDCPWAAWVREFERQPGLTESLPEAIRMSVERDRADTAMLSAWGMSQNFDEGAKMEIVHAPILNALAERMGVLNLQRPGRLVAHAGMLHTYGYLLSNLRTSFGYKRSRWVSGRLEKGLDLPKATLGPDACLLGADASLLAQITYLLMRVALLDHPAEWTDWKAKLEARITRALVQRLAALDRDAITRTVESQTLPGGETIQWNIDLLSLPSDPAGGKLLVYSQRTKAGIRLITGFPVEKSYKPPQQSVAGPRYNAWVD